MSERSYHRATSRSRERNEENVLFNDALNAFYLRVYGVRHMVKDHSDIERKEGRLNTKYLLEDNNFVLKKSDVSKNFRKVGNSEY